MTERMQALQNLQKTKSSRKVTNPFCGYMTIKEEFEYNVLKDQAASVFLVANARLLQKASSLN